ncbi:MAG: hypothetical protein AAB783_00835 [Patescibacteria group bacterium]
MIFRPVAQNRWFIYAIVAFSASGLVLWWQVEQDSIDADTVAATDSIIYVNRKPPVQNTTETISPSTNSGQLETDVSNWKTYRNEKYGFEIKYPPGLFESVDTIEQNGDGQIGVFRALGGRGYLAIDFDPSKFELGPYLQIKIAGTTGAFDENTRDGNSAAIVPLPNNRGQIVIYFCDSTCNFKNGYYLDSDLVKKILLTLKFFEPKTQ